MSRGNQTRRRSNRPNRPIAAGVFTGTALAAVLAALPLHVTVSLSPGPGTAVAGQGESPNPVCQATLTR